MSELERSRALDALVSEAKEHYGTKPSGAEVDWSRLESRVMAAVAEEKPALVREVEAARGGRRSAVRIGAVVLAAAAAVFVYARPDRDGAPRDLGGATATNAAASSLRESVGTGEVRIGSAVATAGAIVRSGDVIEAEGTRAIFERPRKVSWLLEAGASGALGRARVKSAGEPLVLGLEQGAIEAQVVPVASGEAFAVDIATDKNLVRVAVHGTHLRVTREGNHVVVDLTEGVVSIGVPPRTGVTYGTLVTAPAHVELDASDLGTLRIDHAAASVRAPIPLGNREPAPPAVRTEPAPATLEAPAVTVEPAHLAPAASAPKAGRPSAPKADPAVAMSPRDAVSALVRACSSSRSRSGGDVHVTVTTELRLRVSAVGVVESAQFVPPLSPDVQSCAAASLYKLHFEETGLVTIPIEFSF